MHTISRSLASMLKWMLTFPRLSLFFGLLGDLPNVSGTSKELKGPQTLSSSACTREKRRDVTNAEEVVGGAGVKGQGMGGAGRQVRIWESLPQNLVWERGV
jgi:hypothetical protein